jgi:hypothetical protein
LEEDLHHFLISNLTLTSTIHSRIWVQEITIHHDNKTTEEMKAFIIIDNVESASPQGALLVDLRLVESSPPRYFVRRGGSQRGVMVEADGL